ncbi:MAG: methyltransferase domain-containing protein [Pirellulales bacterium]
MAKRRKLFSSNPVELKPGDIEYELGVAVPGTIQPRENWAQTALKRLPESGGLNVEQLFDRQAPLAVEIGCGNGRFTISSGVRRPDWNHLAIDILPAVVRYATRRANQRGLTNVRVAVCDGWRFLQQFLQTNSVDEFHIYHPQPYADPNDSAKRMMTPEFIALMVDRLVIGGKAFLQTDREPYWKYIQQVFQAFFEIQIVDGRWPEDPLGRSRREFLSEQQGLKLYRAVGTKTKLFNDSEIVSLIESLPQPEFKIEQERKLWKKRRRR